MVVARALSAGSTVDRQNGAPYDSTVNAVIFRLRSMLRRRLVSTLVVTLIVAAVCAVVIALAAGADRTATAPERYAAQTAVGFDVLVTQDTGGGAPRTDAVAALPGVESAESVTFVFGGIVGTQADDDNELVFSGTPRALGMALVSGREADPNNPNEFVASRSFTNQNDAAIGDSFDLVTLTPEQVRDQGFGNDPQGPTYTLTLVGIVDGPARLNDPSTISLVSPASLDDPRIGVALTLMAVDLRPDVDIGALRAQLDTLPDSAGFSVEPGVLISEDVRRAVQVQARGLWLLAAAAALASVAALGQLIARQVRPAQSERERLAALGYTDQQVLAESAGFALVPIAAGVLLGAALAVIPSGSFPSGFVRTIEPKPGLLVQWNILLAGAALFVVALALWVLASLKLAQSKANSLLASPMVEAIATRIVSPTGAAGLRFALTRGDRGRGSVAGTILSVTLALAGVVGAITFGVSLDRLLTEPFRYGSNYDIAMGDNGADTLPEGLVDLLNGNSDVESLVVYAGSKARAGDASIVVLGMDVVRGEGTPYVVDGRLPAGEDEIALGQVTAKDIGAHIGDELELAGITQTTVFRVTGLIVVPGFGENDGMGEGGLVTMDGLALIDDSAQPKQVSAQLRVDAVEFFESVPEFADGEPAATQRANSTVTPFMPPAIVNVKRIRLIPFVLAGVLGVLALLTITHVLLLSIRSRRRDRAILSSLGADREWLLRSVHWQATMFALLPVVISVPVGIVAGRLVFAAFATNMGAVSDAALPFAIVGAGGVAVFVAANAIAALPARRASSIEPARLLRTE